MKRWEFTQNIIELLQIMIENGDKPIIDYVMRNELGQYQCFKEGNSKCDGFFKKSYHQTGKAMDIYLIDDKGDIINWDTIPEKSMLYHNKWVEMGGQPEISWDKGHFQDI